MAHHNRLHEVPGGGFKVRCHIAEVMGVLGSAWLLASMPPTHLGARWWFQGALPHCSGHGGAGQCLAAGSMPPTHLGARWCFQGALPHCRGRGGVGHCLVADMDVTSAPWWVPLGETLPPPPCLVKILPLGRARPHLDMCQPSVQDAASPSILHRDGWSSSLVHTVDQ